MPILKVILLAIVQGLAELLPVSSSAHVVVAEKLMGMDPSAPEMTLLLVMLHTGTMFAVIAYFWSQWRRTYFASTKTFGRVASRLIFATLLTGVIGEGLVKLIEKTAFRGSPKAEIEDLFSHLEVVAPALAVAGLLILYAGLRERRSEGRDRDGLANSTGHEVMTGHEVITDHEVTTDREVTTRQAGIIGAVQGLCLPFRGFSRSGATISTGMLAGTTRERAEVFSFALAVILTPPVVLREALRLRHAAQTTGVDLHGAVMSSLLGAVFAFAAGLLALRWLSRWLEQGRWYLFGIYCLVASAGVFYLHRLGY